MQPQYLFLPDRSFIIAVIDRKISEITLMLAVNTEQRLTLSGNFAKTLLSQLDSNQTNISSSLLMIEKQHNWLKGLSQARLIPKNLQNMVIGDELGLLFIEVTDQCNEQCIHCYASSSPSCHNFLSLDEVKAILTQARALGRAFVQFTGGDPLIHRDLVEAVRFAHELDFQSIEIYTNGLLLNADMIEQLFPFNPMIAFSLYSPDAEVHDSITQVRGSFKKTVAAIHRAQDMALKVRIGMAVMQQNAGHEQAMLDFAKDEFFLEAASVRFDPVHETGRGSNLNTKHISLMPSQNSHMPDAGNQTSVQHHQVIQQDKVEMAAVDARKQITRRGKLAVCADGNVSPCIFNREHVLGNIRSQSLAEILNVKSPGQGNIKPSVERWNHCQHNLSCSDCQMVAYTLGETK